MPAHHRAQHRAAAGQGRADGRSAGSQAQLISKEGACAAQAASGEVRRSARIHGHGGQVASGSRERVAGQGGTHPLAGQDAHNRGVTMTRGPPHAGRGQDLRRPPSGHAWASPRAASRRATTAYGQVDRDAESKRGSEHGSISQQGPFTDTHLEIKMAALTAANEKKVVRTVAALHHPSGVRGHTSGPQWQEVHSGIHHENMVGHKLASSRPPGRSGGTR